MSALKTVLDPIGLPVYNYVPDNVDTPFIYIGEIVTEEVAKKDGFMLMGTFLVEMNTGNKKWTGGLGDVYTYLDSIKRAVQPTKVSVLDIGPEFNMTYLKLYNDSGVFQFVPGVRIYSTETVYQFEIVEFGVHLVTHNGEQVTHNGEDVLAYG